MQPQPKLTFKLVTAHNLDNFETAVNDYLSKNYKFVNGMQVTINEVEDEAGTHLQYSICMLLEQVEVNTNG